uniref:Uncharacterized protein n=1 Tax=Anguilla anguilla TaxID=7936 RepID=A0A0E9T7X3_ANGAN
MGLSQSGSPVADAYIPPKYSLDTS